jgi:hypothetical protein
MAKRKPAKRQKPITSAKDLKVEVVYVETEDAEEILDDVVRRIYRSGKAKGYFD